MTRRRRQSPLLTTRGAEVVLGVDVGAGVMSFREIGSPWYPPTSRPSAIGYACSTSTRVSARAVVVARLGGFEQ
jgi:hypothetical protein